MGRSAACRFVALHYYFICFIAFVSATQDVFSYLSQHAKAFDEDLLNLASIPSVATDPSFKEDVLKASEWLRARAIKAGLKAELLQTDGAQPAVYAEWTDGTSDRPTVLVYGHYDVQPAAKEDGWVSEPFQPELHDGAFWGRGVSDDKGGLLQPLLAVEALLKTSGRLPVNVKLLFEGQEEIGSPHLEALLSKHRGKLASDYIFSADGGQISKTMPGIVLGMRGAVALEVHVSAAYADMHSGVYGGSVLNPAQLVAEIAASLHHANGSVAVAGFYDAVQAVDAEMRADADAHPFSEEEESQKLGLSGYVGEDGYSTLERRWYRPTLEVVGIGGGYAGAGMKNIVPKDAVLKLLARIVPNQDPRAISRAMRSHIERFVAGLPANVTIGDGDFASEPFVARRDEPANAIAARVLAELFGKEPLFYRNGGSIPALMLSQQVLGVNPTVFGFGTPDNNIHGPNERFPHRMYHLGIKAYVKLLQEIARTHGAADSADFNANAREEL